ncbi:hypothetical protein BDV19DRAFT_71471 [Aspergillus venezuelensis]
MTNISTSRLASWHGLMLRMRLEIVTRPSSRQKAVAKTRPGFIPPTTVRSETDAQPCSTAWQAQRPSKSYAPAPFLWLHAPRLIGSRILPHFVRVHWCCLGLSTLAHVLYGNTGTATLSASVVTSCELERLLGGWRFGDRSICSSSSTWLSLKASKGQDHTFQRWSERTVDTLIC